MIDAVPQVRAAMALAGLICLGSCAWSGEPPSERATPPRDPDGPLSVGDVVGGQSFLAPRSKPSTWTASQGSFVLCSTDGPVTLEGVRLADDRPPLSVTPWLVSDTPPDSRYVTFGGVLGSPPDFSEPYASGGLVGSYTRRFDGAVIDQPCPAGDVTNGYSEVVLELQTDSSGARVPHWWIDYRAGDEQHTLRVDWTIVLCGSEVRRNCRGGR